MSISAMILTSAFLKKNLLILMMMQKPYKKYVTGGHVLEEVVPFIRTCLMARQVLQDMS